MSAGTVVDPVPARDDATDDAVIGCVGSPWRATVDRGGDIQPWDGSAELRWFIAADDRWHTPAAESAVAYRRSDILGVRQEFQRVSEARVSQRRIDGTPVIETRVRIPSGHAVQRVYATTHAGGMTVMEITNESPLPIAVALTRGDLLSARPPTDLPIQGIDVPPGSISVPVGHQAAITVALAHRRPAAGSLPAGLPSADQVARGWLTTCAQASRLELPDSALDTAVVHARCAALLDAVADPDRHPDEFLVTIGELVRLGEPADPWLADIVVAAERVLRGGPGTWRARTAVDAAAAVFTAAGEDRAAADVARSVRRWSTVDDRPSAAPAGIWVVPWAEQLVSDRRGALFPFGLPPEWAGANFEAHGLPVHGGRVSFAVRWHGARPAVLWQTEGSVALTAPVLAPGWSTSAADGEALWPEYAR